MTKTIENTAGETCENSIKTGIVDGLPICFGYISVSFAFGMMAVSMGLPWYIAVLISLTNVTSAGQFAGIGILAAGGSPVEMALTQLVINLRYALMSLTISQKLHKSVKTADRFAIGFGMTDEIFAVSAGKPKEIGKWYMFGLILTPVLGWTFGTFLGSVAGTLLPEGIRSALELALYGMFIAIVVPPAKKERAVALVVFLSMALSCLVRYIPFLAAIFSGSGGGFTVIVCSVIAAVIGALVKPIDTENA